MYRFVLIAALTAPIAGLALTLENGSDTSANTLEIRVSAEELAECRATMAELDERPVYTDGGLWLPDFLLEDDLVETVCVVDTAA